MPVAGSTPRSSIGGDLAIAVIDHHTPVDLLRTVLARVANAAPRARLLLVDTGGGGPPAEDALPPGTQRLSVANRSYSYAVNRGLERLDRPYLALMNADVLVERDTFARLTAVLRTARRTGVVGPLALNAAGRPQDLGLPYRLNYARAARAGHGGVKVPWLSGCLQIVDRRLWLATGGYDESLRFTNEDLEFCLRAGRLGWECRLLAAPVVHLGGTSTPSHPAFHVEGRRGGYVVTSRYRTPLEAFVLRGFLRTEALLGSRLARESSSREAHRAMQHLLRRGDWQHSPFGPTLDDR